MARLAIEVPIQPLNADSEARALLKAFWKDKWSRMEKEIEDAGVQIDAIKNLPPPWDQVKVEAQSVMGFSDQHLEALRRRYLWPDSTSMEQLSAQFGPLSSPLDDYALAEIEAIALERQGLILDGIERYKSQADKAIASAWKAGRVRSAPFYLPAEESDDSRSVLFTSGGSLKGWSIGFVIHGDEAPDLLETRAQLERMRKERDGAVQEYLTRAK